MTDHHNGAAPIRTPDQRLRVFVSSTLAELAEERAAVARAVSALRLTPVLFELGARPHPPQELYRSYLAQSDIFVGLYWQRYGWVGPGMDISGLEDELQLSGARPRLLYVKTPAPDREARLTALIEQLQAEGTDSYRPFRTPRELGRLVRDDLALLLSERFAAASAAGASSTAVPVAGAAGSGESEGVRRRARSLPAVATSLVGRDQDIARVSELLATPGVRLVTLTGPGGIGKTRLAGAVGERVEDRDPQGVVFVPLASITEPELVLPRVATALGVAVEGTRSALDAVAEQLGDTPTLLVLDNLEQVAAVAPRLDELLAQCPGLVILATSRTVLRLRAEREYPVGPLSASASAGELSLGELAALPAVELFVDRARGVRPDFALTEGNAPVVAEICRRLDGLPLAIELAAARTRLLDPATLLARLGNRLDTLGTGPVDLPERQRTLRATVAWSIGLLDEAERALLTALSVFVDGWTVDAALDVAGLAGAGDDRTLDLLDALAGHSLLTLAPVTLADGDGPRFRMLESVRELAGELLTATDGGAGDTRAEVERRHADHFRRFLEANDWPAQGQAEWADRLLADEGNLRAAVRWFLGHDIAPLPHLFFILWLFWQMRDRMGEGRAWIDELLPRVDELDDRARAELVLTSAVTAIEVGDDARAVAAAEWLDRLGPVADPDLRSLIELVRSWILPIVDDLDGALAAASAALDDFRRQDERFMIVSAAMTLGMLEMVTGRHQEARAHLVEAGTLSARFGNNWLSAGARVQLASLAIEAGDLDQARALLTESLTVDDDARLSTHTVTFCLVTYAELALAEDRPATAAEALGAADALRRHAGLRVWPSARRGEEALRARVEGALPPDEYEVASTRGAGHTRRRAAALIRAGLPVTAA